jgi:hypothetical protein
MLKSFHFIVILPFPTSYLNRACPFDIGDVNKNADLVPVLLLQAYAHTEFVFKFHVHFAYSAMGTGRGAFSLEVKAAVA